jgi:hypothetical protein
VTVAGEVVNVALFSQRGQQQPERDLPQENTKIAKKNRISPCLCVLWDGTIEGGAPQVEFLCGKNLVGNARFLLIVDGWE